VLQVNNYKHYAWRLIIVVAAFGMTELQSDVHKNIHFNR